MNKKYKCVIALFSFLVLGCQTTSGRDEQVAHYKFHDFERTVTYEGFKYKPPQVWQFKK